MDDNKILEITQMMAENGGSNIKGDVSHAAQLVRNMFFDKYINPIQSAFKAENDKARKNPCDHARLLSALKPFVKPSGHKNVDEAVDALHLMQTFKKFNAARPTPPTAAFAAAQIEAQ